MGLQEGKITRKEGLEYLKKLYKGELPQGDIRVSKLYPPEKARPKSSVWWLQPSLKSLHDGEMVHLLCEKENREGFYYLCVPVKYIEDYAKKGVLEIRSHQKRDFIHLEISARSEDLFQDLRGRGKVSFANYLVE